MIVPDLEASQSNSRVMAVSPDPRYLAILERILADKEPSMVRT